MDGRTEGRTDDAKTISLRLRQGITSDKCAIVYLHGPVSSSMSLGMFENEGEIL